MTVFCVHLEVNQPQAGASGVVRSGRRHGSSITYKITPCWVTLLQPARRTAVSGQPSSLRPHCSPWSIHSGAQTGEFLDWRWPLSGVHSIMMVKSAQSGVGGGCTPFPFTLSTITSKVVVYAPAERAFIYTYIYTYTYTLPLYPYMYSVVLDTATWAQSRENIHCVWPLSCEHCGIFGPACCWLGSSSTPFNLYYPLHSSYVARLVRYSYLFSNHPTFSLLMRVESAESGGDRGASLVGRNNYLYSPTLPLPLLSGYTWRKG